MTILTSKPQALSAFRQETLAFLRDNGYGSPTAASDHLLFQADGLTFCVLLDEQDPEYVRISLPNFHRCESTIERQAAELVAAECQRRYKLGEYTIVDHWVSAQVPLLVDTSEFLTRDRLFRLTQSLRSMAQDFVEALRATLAAGSPRQ